MTNEEIEKAIVGILKTCDLDQNENLKKKLIQWTFVVQLQIGSQIRNEIQMLPVVPTEEDHKLLRKNLELVLWGVHEDVKVLVDKILQTITEDFVICKEMKT